MGENIVAGGVERVLRRFLFSREHQVEITLRFLANSSGTKKKEATGKFGYHPRPNSTRSFSGVRSLTPLPPSRPYSETALKRARVHEFTLLQFCAAAVCYIPTLESPALPSPNPTNPAFKERQKKRTARGGSENGATNDAYSKTGAEERDEDRDGASKATQS